MTKFCFWLGLVIVCPGEERPAIVSDYCQSYQIIRPSRRDTDDTQRQIATANARFRSVCRRKANAP